MLSEREILSLHRTITGARSVSGGASTTACQHILPTVLREFRRGYPKCEIRIEPGDHGQQLDLLRSGQIDLAIVLEPPAPTMMEFTFSRRTRGSSTSGNDDARLSGCLYRMRRRPQCARCLEMVPSPART